MKNRILVLMVLACFGISGLSGCGRTGQEPGRSGSICDYRSGNENNGLG